MSVGSHSEELEIMQNDGGYELKSLVLACWDCSRNSNLFKGDRKRGRSVGVLLCLKCTNHCQQPDNEECGMEPTKSVHTAREMKVKAVKSLLWTTRAGEQERKIFGPTLKLPEKMQGRSCYPWLELRVAAGSQTSLCLYCSCLLWKAHRLQHFTAHVTHQGLWFTTMIYLGTAHGHCGKAQILQFTAPGGDSWWKRSLKRDLQKIQNCPNYSLRLNREAKIWLCLCKRKLLPFSQN